MDAKVNYTVVGIIGVVLIVVFLGLLIWMSQRQSDKNFNTYVSYFKQEVTGLSEQSAVRLNGIKVGAVKSIGFVKDNMQEVQVIMRINKKIKITTTTYAVMESEGLTGNEYIALKAKTPTAPLLKAKPGEKYPVIPTEESLLGGIEKELKGTTAEIKKLVDSINDLLDQKNREAISQSLANIAKITNTIASNSKNIDKSLTAMEGLLHNTEIASKQFPEMIRQTRATLKSFQEVSSKFSSVSTQTSNTLAHTNTAIQNISSQLMPTAQQLLQQLNGMITNMMQFGEDLSRNPSVLIRGKTPAPLGPGEK